MKNAIYFTFVSVRLIILALACILLARLHQLLQMHWAPLILSSLLLGCGIAGLVLLDQAYFGSRRVSRRQLALKTMLLAVVTVMSVHYFYFRHQRLASYETALGQAKLAVSHFDAVGVEQPDLGFQSFRSFMIRQQHDRENLGLWLLDAIVVSGSALTLVFFTRSFKKQRIASKDSASF